MKMLKFLRVWNLHIIAIIEDHDRSKDPYKSKSDIIYLHATYLPFGCWPRGWRLEKMRAVRGKKGRQIVGSAPLIFQVQKHIECKKWVKYMLIFVKKLPLKQGTTVKTKDKIVTAQEWTPVRPRASLPGLIPAYMDNIFPFCVHVCNIIYRQAERLWPSDGSLNGAVRIIQ